MHDGRNRSAVGRQGLSFVGTTSERTPRPGAPRGSLEGGAYEDAAGTSAERRPTGPRRTDPGRRRLSPVRIGLLTGGGDCPGLNAAIQAVVRHALDEIGATVYGFRDGWRGVMEVPPMSSPATTSGGRLEAARSSARRGCGRSDPRRHRAGARDNRGASARRVHRDRRRGHDERMRRDARRPGGRGAEDDRQRHRRHRSQHRVPDRRADRDRPDRPALQHGREPPTRDGLRGHGAQCRMDRARGGPRQRPT